MGSLSLRSLSQGTRAASCPATPVRFCFPSWVRIYCLWSRGKPENQPGRMFWLFFLHPLCLLTICLKEIVFS